MDKQLSWRLCANLRGDRRKPLATSQNLLMLMLCVCLGCGTHPDKSAACPTIEVRAVADAQSDSTRPVVLDDGSTIPLTKTPLVTNADITGANASLTDGQWVLNLDMTNEGAKRLQDFTKRNVGRTMAFLVDGKVHSTPRILDPIKGTGFLIGGRFERADAERLATAIDNSCTR
ncbi:MAG: SecDF P1 head subdomain-containing protein [Gemmatimonadaceae bacterium]